jgi:hypothetical protein
MKTFTKLALACTVAVGSLSVGQVFAHHSAAMFDDAKEVVMTGVVTKFDYLNPHSWLFIDVAQEDGTTAAWGFELAAPPRLQRIGVGPQNWVPGDLIVVKGNPLRDGRAAGNLVGAIKVDGATFGNVEGLDAPSAEAAK